MCYSEFLDRHYSVGTSASCEYSYSDREVELVFEYSADASNTLGAGNVTITLVCGRTLVRREGVREGGREGVREGGTEGGRQGGRRGGKEGGTGGREGEGEGVKEAGIEGGRE